MRPFLQRCGCILLLTFAAAGTVRAQDYKAAYTQALEAARARQFVEAHGLFVRAARQARQAGDAETADRALKVAAQIDYNMGKKFSDVGQPASALRHFDSGIQLVPAYPKNHLGRVVALVKLNRMADALAAYRRLAEVGEAAGAPDDVAVARKALRDQYVHLASIAVSRNGEEITRQDGDEALAHLTALQQVYDGAGDADVQYYLAVAHTARGEYDEAIARVNRALAVQQGSAADRARLYFTLGEAHYNKGDEAAARAAFLRAVHGPYQARAEYYLQALGTD